MTHQSEEWVQWHPPIAVATKYLTQDIFDRAYGLQIELSDSKDSSNRLLLSFSPRVYAYRSCDETLRYNLIHLLSNRYGESFYGYWNFFIIKNSSYIRQLALQARGECDLSEAVHYCLLGADLVIDIAATSEPQLMTSTIERSEQDPKKEQRGPVHDKWYSPLFRRDLAIPPRTMVTLVPHWQPSPKIFPYLSPRPHALPRSRIRHLSRATTLPPYAF